MNRLIFLIAFCGITLPAHLFGAQKSDETPLPIISQEIPLKEVPVKDVPLKDDGVVVLKSWDNAGEILNLAVSIAAQSEPTTPEHKSYNDFIQGKWKRLKELSLDGAKGFEENELANIPSGAQVFYPFGGPDMVYPLVLFPKASNYILIGLEPTGTIDDTQKPINYSYLKGMMTNIFNSGFFVTDKMNRNLKNTGTLPVLLGLIVKMECTPTKVEEIDLRGLKGIRIWFHNAYGDAQNVAYYQGDLTKIDPEIFGTSEIALIKCCSYFMHGQNVPRLKKYLLKKVDYLIQDDTGIPLREIIKTNRSNTFYGIYTKPYGNDFPWAVQPDLAEVYATKKNVKELGFRVGYGFGRAPSNLMLSVLNHEEEAQ